jgi:trk system potassium uptake protein TrkA
MYIIVVGGGKVGYSLSRALLSEDHEVLVIEKDPARCERINEDLGTVCMRGDGCEAATLAEAGAARADMLVATTDEDEDNLVACQVAKHKFGVGRTIAIANNPKNESIFRKLGIDCTVSATSVLLEHIEEEVPTHPVVQLLHLEPEGREVIEVKVLPGAEAIGKRVSELSLSEDTLLCALLRKGSVPIIPTDDTVVREGDKFLVVTTEDRKEELRTQLASG